MVQVLNQYGKLKAAPMPSSVTSLTCKPVPGSSRSAISGPHARRRIAHAVRSGHEITGCKVPACGAATATRPLTAQRRSSPGIIGARDRQEPLRLSGPSARKESNTPPRMNAAAAKPPASAVAPALAEEDTDSLSPGSCRLVIDDNSYVTPDQREHPSQPPSLSSQNSDAVNRYSTSTAWPLREPAHSASQGNPTTPKKKSLRMDRLYD
ncbi:hypothetical protein HPB47_005292 [Ixodes persulcatus]|uniref:Uncharacterized protein n=1 Tax=Ixodes persulcatus TaxID=34615 RepID=A0AC60PE95_IXOPE|nr:hypothetical protein HPB47_005292 [Ixodes persulcatus]